jgi:hypothetical protein
MGFCNHSHVELLNLTRIDVKLISFMIGHFDETHPAQPRHPTVALSGVDINGLLERILRLYCSERVFQISQRRFLTCLHADRQAPYISVP